MKNLIYYTGINMPRLLILKSGLSLRLLMEWAMITKTPIIVEENHMEFFFQIQLPECSQVNYQEALNYLQSNL